MKRSSVENITYSINIEEFKRVMGIPLEETIEHISDVAKGHTGSIFIDTVRECDNGEK